MKKELLSEIFGQNIQRKRKQLGMTQDALAERLGIGQQSLSRMERGTMAPKFERLQEIADVLHCSVAELFIASEQNLHEVRLTLCELINDLTKRESDAVMNMVREMVAIFKENRKS